MFQSSSDSTLNHSKTSNPLSPEQIVSGIPSELWKSASGYSDVYTLEMGSESVRPLDGIRLTGMERFLALTRKDPWFLAPAWGESESDAPKTECQLMLWKRTDGLWAAITPVCHGNRRAWLQPDIDGLCLQIRGSQLPSEPEQLCLAIMGVGSDPYELVQSIVRVGMERIHVARPREDKAVPEWCNWLGWCTWDAFYSAVTAEKIIGALEAFQRDGLAVPFLLIDDGWQQYQDHQLMSFAPDASKFPDGLLGLSRTARDQFGIHLVGVWHALVGYWNGVSPKGNLSSDYRLCTSFHGAYNVPEGKDLSRSLVHPRDIHRFYNDFHKYLRSQGVDMVKIDNQSSLDHFTENLLPDVDTMAQYQSAIQGSAAVHFGNNLLHCMAMSNDVAWNLSSSAVWRNSQDYFPKRPESHGEHLVNNAANALWSSHFALPDWDMFHSGSAAGWFHAAARAMSGGPVYFSDELGKHDPALLKSLCLSNGSVPRPPYPAKVAESRILVDCTTQERLLLVRNQTAAGYLLGVFHCRYTDPGTAITDQWYPSDAGAQGRVVVRGFQSGICEVVDASQPREIRLEPLGWEIFTLSPIINGLAVIGLDGKLAGAAAILQVDTINESLTRVTLQDGGDFRVWSDKPLIAYDESGKSMPIAKSNDDSYLITVPTGNNVKLLIERK